MTNRLRELSRNSIKCELCGHDLETAYHWMYGCTVNDVKILEGMLREFDFYSYI